MPWWQPLVANTLVPDDARNHESCLVEGTRARGAPLACLGSLTCIGVGCSRPGETEDSTRGDIPASSE